MRIKKVVVKNLFGMLNYVIPLNTDEHITIIHGPNGYGKTILLTLINAIFNSQYQRLFSIPFSELSVDFDNKGTLILKKESSIEIEEKKKSRNGEPLIFQYHKPGAKTKLFKIKNYDPEDLPFSLSIIERMIPTLERIAVETWRHTGTGEVLSLEDVILNYGLNLPLPAQVFEKKNEEPAWMRNTREAIQVYFIETQRLLNISVSKPRVREYERRSSMVPTVSNFSKELADAIQSKLAEYGSLSQSLDRTFPTRLVKLKHSDGHAVEQLKIELDKLEKKRSRLIAAGLLDEEKEIDFRELQKIDESNVNVLSVYIEDVKQKLSVFDELTSKIDLMLQIVNSRFLHKKLSISKRDGFIFTTFGGKRLPPTSLSSGEQHELVLLYELLFKVSPGSLILIDEPELSLHVVWQQQFLEDLQDIARLVGIDVLIATHSPQIINDRWDLTVELEGPKQ